METLRTTKTKDLNRCRNGFRTTIRYIYIFSNKTQSYIIPDKEGLVRVVSGPKEANPRSLFRRLPPCRVVCSLLRLLRKIPTVTKTWTNNSTVKIQERKSHRKTRRENSKKTTDDSFELFSLFDFLLFRILDSRSRLSLKIHFICRGSHGQSSFPFNLKMPDC